MPLSPTWKFTSWSQYPDSLVGKYTVYCSYASEHSDLPDLACTPGSWPRALAKGQKFHLYLLCSTLILTSNQPCGTLEQRSGSSKVEAVRLSVTRNQVAACASRHSRMCMPAMDAYRAIVANIKKIDWKHRQIDINYT